MKLKNKNLYYVGGIVRDELLSIKNFDIDYCYEGNAIDFSKDYDVIKTNDNFGTVRIFFENEEIDIASTRTEYYPKPGHLPVVKKIGCTLEEDLKRRDFTINALAKNTITGEIIDFFGGLEDIKSKKIRVLHDNSFIDDPSRIIRGLKFSIRFNFELEKNTRKLQDEYLNSINYDLSFHRLKKELKETFNLNSQKAFDKFISQKIYKLLGQSQKEPNITHSIEDLISSYNPQNVWIVYLGLFNLENFELTSEEKNIIDCYQIIKSKKFNNDLEIYKAFIKKPLESILLYALSVDYEVARYFLENLSHIKIETTGYDLKKIGFTQGKIYNKIFNLLLEEKIKNPLLTKNDELIIAKKLLLK